MSDTVKENKLELRAPYFKPPNLGEKKKQGDTRTQYQHDLGRIVHSASFRRLQAKTQVMGTGEGDFHRTRLTHSLEVGHVGRGIIWNLKESTDNNRIAAKNKEYLPCSELIEAICYAHDLGHPPFGHGGERALERKMSEFGGFEGNAQTIRILTQLEKYHTGEGIKPTRRLLLGVLKYPVAYSEYGEISDESKKRKCFYDSDMILISDLLEVFSEDDVKKFRSFKKGKPQFKSFDCSIMELADDISYGVHDLEDGIGRGILKRDMIEEKIRSGFKEAGVRDIFGCNIDDLTKKLFSNDTCKRKRAISLLVGYFITEIAVEKRGIFESNYLDLKACVSKNTRKMLDHLATDITYQQIVQRREVQTLEYKGEKIISDLFDTFSNDPIKLIGEHGLDPFGSGDILRIIESQKTSWKELPDPERNQVARAICDFIAGMTNPYAENYHRRLFEPGFGSSTDEL